jgi:glutathione synthase/RimK-type ligase-like ATP-grasp enzyme
VIVIYTESVAKSAKDKTYKEKTPFSLKKRYKIYNDSYRYFLTKCKKMGISCAFATSKDIIGPGLFKSFWTFDKVWIRNFGQAQSKILFDKFTPITFGQKKKLKILTVDKNIHMFNNRKMVEVFQNKLNTYKMFDEITIPTVEITKPSRKTIVQAKIKLDKLLKKHKLKQDFINGYLVKNIIGTGGFKIHKINFEKSAYKEIMKNYKFDKKFGKILSYILQPFISCRDGFVFGARNELIDLRVILINHKIIQAYIRIAKPGNFECNEHQGGNLVYIPVNKIPKDVLKMIKKITEKLDLKINLSHSLYALDFMRTNTGNLFFLEGNSNPGIDWNHAKKLNEIKSKELIDLIIQELKLIIKEK